MADKESPVVGIPVAYVVQNRLKRPIGDHDVTLGTIPAPRPVEARLCGGLRFRQRNCLFVHLPQLLNHGLQ